MIKPLDTVGAEDDERLARSSRYALPSFPSATARFCTSSTPLPPRSVSESSSASQLDGTKWSIGSGGTVEDNRRTASPSAQDVVPEVFPVAAKIDVPSLAMPDGAHTAPPSARVCHPFAFCGASTGMATIVPWYVPQSPKW